ncbi:hypothetical protein LZ198_26255 [Myxococcus sp. K15C18031901]|uniref:hypothetical protein n=1 Tax=Myxococcus dinghuensis TaxID=2906761 RepID=UPI0020A81474|nr:hypothetical protein [Myxococcus dinghuensis]MCP3102379.1 hypothetical protein [Myxococcus dinghuensis]
MYYPVQSQFVRCGSYGCRNVAQVHPSAQCPFCAYYLCMAHGPGPCQYCGVFVCSGCWAASRPCCTWAKNRPQSSFSMFPSSSGSGGASSSGSGGASSGGYSSAAGINTDDLENAIKDRDRWPTFVDYNEGVPFDFWQSGAFPGLNVKFLIVGLGALFEVHVKWDKRLWFRDEPYAMSLKVAIKGSKNDLCRESRPNIMSDSHRYLWGNLLARARKLLANHHAAMLMNEFGLKNAVTAAMVRTLVSKGRTSDLAALYLCSTLPLSVWEQEAWSMMLDELTK